VPLGTIAPQDNPRRRVKALGGDARFAGRPGHLGCQGIYLVATPDDNPAPRPRCTGDTVGPPVEIHARLRGAERDPRHSPAGMVPTHRGCHGGLLRCVPCWCRASRKWSSRLACTHPAVVGLLFISGAASLILAVLGFAFSLNGYIYIRVELFLLKIWIAVGFILRGGATSVLAISDPELPGRGRIIAFGVIGLNCGHPRAGVTTRTGVELPESSRWFRCATTCQATGCAGVTDI
jgi:hypothetical protein